MPNNAGHSLFRRVSPRGHRIDPVPVGLDAGGHQLTQYFCGHDRCHRDLEKTPTGYRHLDSHTSFDRLPADQRRRLGE